MYGDEQAPQMASLDLFIVIQKIDEEIVDNLYYVNKDMNIVPSSYSSQQ